MSNLSLPTYSLNRARSRFIRERPLRILVLLTFTLTAIIAGCARVDSYLKIEVSKGANPWTHLNFCNNPDEFQFAIVGDRTGEHKPDAFENAVEKLNLLRPEFVISVGDFIEGYNDDETKLNRQWDEFDSIVGKLKMPFFYVPGNHDIGNELTAGKWQQHLGRTYYHFVYHNVLFLCLNTAGASEGWIDNKQIEYIQNVLVRYWQVRWTCVFMHHPIWRSQSSESWRKIQALLADRCYTVFSGHQHAYFKSIRDDATYYILSTTGGQGSNHIVWVTMTDEGPVITNLLLEGILDDNFYP